MQQRALWSLSRCDKMWSRVRVRFRVKVRVRVKVGLVCFSRYVDTWSTGSYRGMGIN